MFPVLGVNAFYQFKALGGGNQFDSIHPSGFLSLVVLRHSSYSQ